MVSFSTRATNIYSTSPMNTARIIIVIFTSAILGVTSIIYKILQLNKKYQIVEEYINKYRLLLNSTNDKSFDNDLYTWLTMNSVKMQEMMGPYGLISYRAPFTNYEIPKYQIILNVLSGIRADTAHDNLLKAADDALLRYVGLLTSTKDNIVKDLYNPFKWISTGVQTILSIPVYILNWCGLIGSPAVNAMTMSAIFRIVSGLITFIGLLASIMTIIIGWNSFCSILKKII